MCIESASGEREGVDFSPLRKSPGPTTRGVEGKECRRGEGSLSRDQDMPEKGNRAIKVAPVPLIFPRWHSGKESACQCRRRKRCRFNPYTEEDPLEEEMAAHFSILAWRIPWTGEPGGLQSMGHKESDTAEHTHTMPLI